MPLTLTFFAFDPEGTERTLRRTAIPDDALIVYQLSPEIALTVAQNGMLAKPDGFRITDGQGRSKMSFSKKRR